MKVQSIASTSTPELLCVLSRCYHHLVSPSHHIILSPRLIPCCCSVRLRALLRPKATLVALLLSAPTARWQQRPRVPAPLCTAQGQPGTCPHLLPWVDHSPQPFPQLQRFHKRHILPVTQPTKLFKSSKTRRITSHFSLL